jgi:hypothetical protein
MLEGHLEQVDRAQVEPGSVWLVEQQLDGVEQPETQEHAEELLVQQGLVVPL